MKIEDFLTEEELNEYKIVDYAMNMKALNAATEAFQLRTNDTDTDEFKHATMLDLAAELDMRPKILQNYLTDKGLLK